MLMYIHTFEAWKYLRHPHVDALKSCCYFIIRFKPIANPPFETAPIQAKEHIHNDMQKYMKFHLPHLLQTTSSAHSESHPQFFVILSEWKVTKHWSNNAHLSLKIDVFTKTAD